MAKEFVTERLSDYEIERLGVMSGPVRVSIADQGVLEPAHV